MEGIADHFINTSEEVEKGYVLQGLISALLAKKEEFVRGLSDLHVEKSRIEDKEVKMCMSQGMDGINKDDSIIDVTGKVNKIEYKHFPEVCCNAVVDVPYWAHTYVYSARELEYASPRCRYFYKQFKKAFLKGIYYDLKGNSNYCFVLLFDLLEDYKKHKDLTILMEQINALILHYSETESYAVREFIERVRERYYAKDRTEEDCRILQETVKRFPDSYYWRLSEKYGYTLNFTKKEAEILDFIAGKYGPITYGVEVIRIKEINFFREVIKALEHKYGEEGSSLDKMLSSLAEELKLRDRREFDYDTSSYRMGYKTTEEKVKEIYNCIYLFCHNKIQLKYDLGSPSELYFYMDFTKGKNILPTRFFPEIEPLIDEMTGELPGLTDEEEVEVNKQYTTRWRKAYKVISEDYSEHLGKYLEATNKLIKLNEGNPGLRHLLFEVTKFLATRHKILALKTYVRYVSLCAQNTEFVEKPIPKYVCKNLFTTEAQQNEFERIVHQYKLDKKQEKAYEAVNHLFEPKKKHLQFDLNKIERTEMLYADTVRLLDEVMGDEEEKAEEVISEEVAPVSVVAGVNKMENTLLNPVHMRLLDIFKANDHILNKLQVEEYAKKNRLFANQLIEQINDLCYEELDDVLIEENNNDWVVEESYLYKIMNHEC